uniref:Uncharacterized protein n=1 Tax=Spumella elongata TaxID=89044 RepID=A0A7S3MCY0_9STRA
MGEDATQEACESFNKAVSNLLSIQDTFENFGNTRALLDEVKKSFESRIRVFTDRAYLNENKWRAWSENISFVAKELVLLKSIARSAPVYKVHVDEAIAALLARYKARCATEEVANDFIARLGTELAASVSNGIGQQLIEETTEFGGYKNQLRNLQFDRVGIEAVLSSITDTRERSELRFLYKQFVSRYWDLVEKGLPKQTRRAYIEAMPSQVKALADTIMNATNALVVSDGLFFHRCVLLCLLDAARSERI